MANCFLLIVEADASVPTLYTLYDFEAGRCTEAVCRMIVVQHKDKLTLLAG